MNDAINVFALIIAHRLITGLSFQPVSTDTRKWIRLSLAKIWSLFGLEFDEKRLKNKPDFSIFEVQFFKYTVQFVCV